MSAPRKDWVTFKERLRRQLEEARGQTDALFDLLHPAAFYERPIEERHRIIFYLGHLEAFDWNMIGANSFQLKPLHKEFERLFAFGIDPVGGGLPKDRPSDWPTVETVRRYVVQVRRAVDDCLAKADFSAGDQRYVRDGLIFSVVIEHRLMHLETLSYMLHWLPYDLKIPINPPAPGARPAPQHRQIRVAPGQAKLGLRRAALAFGWDNEFEGHSVDVPEFEIDVYKVSNEEFLAFVDADGYQQQSLWAEDAWNWIGANGVRHPKFWMKRGDDWWYRGTFGEIPLPLSWPVYVSQAEAAAYARWKDQSLPTEPEFHRAAFGDTSVERSMPAAAGNFGLRRWDPLPVDANEQQTTAPYGAVEMIGNGWEWTSTAFAPFAGFERFPFYPGYSADFFDNKHFVLKGASPRTAAPFTRPSFRNWFQPLYPHIYAGFRCVRR